MKMCKYLDVISRLFANLPSESSMEEWRDLK